MLDEKLLKKAMMNVTDDTIITFGKYKDKTFRNVYDSYKHYVEFILAVQNPGKDFNLFREYIKRKEDEKAKIITPEDMKAIDNFLNTL